MAALQKAWGWYQLQLARKPIRTQMITSSILWAVGDCAAQRLDSTFEDKQDNHASSRKGLDYRRVALTSSFGLLFVGPVGHLWYEGLEHVVKHRLKFQPNSAKFITAKVLADGLIFGPIHLFSFFSYMSLASGSTIEKLKEELRRDFLPAFLTEGLMWPVVQVVNFRFIPVQHQLLFVNAFCILDSAFLSWFKHQNDAPWKAWLSSLVVNDRGRKK
ncbi:hypothetical protein KP509_34G026800 [Ceratopteris richardii]|uniref:Uncharacterized protein n=1 Tax=Ceratopteris richardii TaxID=49495 RepID=A0A8T2QI62_CERRI|nr:hypothetical protein KP509_34G026800 [Ceratopteris richardii]